MFNRTRRSILSEVETENPELAAILKSVNELLRMARGKLTYMQKVLEYYNRGAYIEQDKAKEFLQANLGVLANIELLLKKESVIEASEETMRLVFSEEINTLEEARDTLKKLRHILEKENAILNASFDFWKVPGEERMRIDYKKIAAMAGFVQQEVELLGIESQKIQTVASELKMLRERIANSRKMPIVVAQYYHGSGFIFNVGDKIRPSLPKMKKREVIEVEEIFEEVRKREFPHRPSRMSAVYVDTHPWTAENYGTAYAVKVEGIVLKTDQDIFTQARIEWGDHKNRQEIEDWARRYWAGTDFPGIPEIIVNGTVTIIGLADYFKQGGRVEVIVDGMKDDRGVPIPKGSTGVIESYDQWNKEVPFYVRMEYDRKGVSLPASTIRKIKK